MANGKEVPRLDFTSSTTPGQQIHKFDHTQTANPCDWLPCRRAALPLVSCPHSLVYLHLPVVEGLIFCISATPHLGTPFPLFHAPPGQVTLPPPVVGLEPLLQDVLRRVTMYYLAAQRPAPARCARWCGPRCPRGSAAAASPAGTGSAAPGRTCACAAGSQQPDLGAGAQ